jgi:hypothetical protein
MVALASASPRNLAQRSAGAYLPAMRAALRSLRPTLVPVVVAALAVAAGVAPSACSEQALPGTMYGMYKVTGQSTANTCGAGLDAPDPWVFDAQLSQSGTTIYWSWMDGNAPLSGPLVSTGHASITADESANVDSTDAGLGPCTMARTDDIELTFVSGSPPASFTGTISYSFTVPSGSTCTDQLSANGGQYDTLPCTISYTTSAAIQ